MKFKNLKRKFDLIILSSLRISGHKSKTHIHDLALLNLDIMSAIKPTKTGDGAKTKILPYFLK